LAWAGKGRAMRRPTTPTLPTHANASQTSST
jgi:hypothetical protein